MTLPRDPAWFITGCSTGFGRALTEIVLGKGWRLVATARNVKSLEGMKSAQGARVFALPLDVTSNHQIAAATKAAESAFGGIDVLVNNAGHGYLAAIEEGEDGKIRELFDTNVFGLAALTRAVLPGMRARKTGWVVNISSAAGLAGNPGSGYYAASKFAVEGMSEALSKECEPLGIKVLLVEPGPFRTDFAGRSITQSPEIQAYEKTSGIRRAQILKADGVQPGDPVKACEAILAALNADNPPLRLVLGQRALDFAEGKLASVRKDIDAWKDVSLATDFVK